MSRRARLAVLAALAAVAATLAVGSGALTTTTVDHDAAVGVAAPGEGYLGFERATGTAGDATVLLSVTNRFPVPVTVTATVRDGAAGPPAVLNVTGPGRLATGAAGSVTAVVRCGDAAGRERVTVVVEAVGRGVEASATRRVDMVCGGPAAVAAGETPTSGP